MQFVSAVSLAADTERALSELCASTAHRLRGAAPDLLVAFISPQHFTAGGGAEAISAVLRDHFPTAVLDLSADYMRF